MKKLIVALMVLSTFASCGKNNSVSQGTNTIGSSTAMSAPIDQYGRVPLVNYITDVNNNAFGAARADSETLRFLNYTGGSSGNGCTLKIALGFIPYYSCSNSYSNSSNAYGNYDTVNVVHSTENLSSKKNELLSIINQAYQYYNSADRKQLYVKVSNGDEYTIDYRVPMSANPVVKYSASNGTTRTFDYSFSGYSAY